MADEELTKETIDGYHSKGIPMWSGDLVNKGSFLAQVKLFTFFDGSELPFEIDGNLNMKTRMPFGKARMILPRPMFDPALPMISKVEPLRYKNLAYLYTEIRGINDVNNNISKTAEFLLMHELVAVIQTSKDTKMYLFPTCSLSHELGITHKNHPQMLHGLFVKFLINKGTQTPQGYTMEQLYKAGLAKQDKEITRDKVTVYQIKSDKPKDHIMSNGLEKGDVEENSKVTDSKPISESSKSSDTAVTADVTRTTTNDIATTTTSNTALAATTTTANTVLAATTTTANTVLAATTTTSSTALVVTAISSSGTTASSNPTVSTPLPAVTSSIVPSSSMCTMPSSGTLTVPTTKDSASGSNTMPSEESIPTTSNKAEDLRGTEPRIGQKRPATDNTGASTPTKRTREMLRSSLQQLLEGKSSVSEDDTPKTPTKSTNITDVQLDNISVTDEVFQHLESAMSMISNRELHSVIKPQQTSSNSSPAKLQPAVTTSTDLVVNDNLTTTASQASGVEDKTNTQFNVPTVVYNKPCKRPKSILKGGNQLDDANLVSEDSPTAPTSAKVPRKIGLAEYKKRHKERRDSEDVVEDAGNNTAMEIVAESTGKTSVDSASSSPIDHLMIVENTSSSLDGTATSKANSDVSVSFKEEKKGDSPSKSESLSVVSKSQCIAKPIKIPHPMSVLAPSSSAIIPHKYTSNLAELSMSYYPSPTFCHDWTTNYPLFGGLSRPYLMPHPPTAPLPSSILTTTLIPSVPPPPPVVYDPLPSVSTQKADEEMARVEDLTNMFTKNLQNKLKHVICSGDSSSESSPTPRRTRSLSRSQSPPPRLSRRGRSPRRSRKSNSRSQSLDSCRGSDHEQVRSRSKSPRSHKSHRSRRHRSSSRDSSVEERRHSRSLKRRNDKRRDHKSINILKTMSTQTEENTYKSGDTKRLSEKEVQTDRLLFVHSRGSQTYPMFENHKAVQVDTSVASNFYADFAQYLETYPLDMFNFSDILSTSISYFEQEISKAFPCNKTLTSKQLTRILEFNHMKKLRSKLSTLLKESQNLTPYMAEAYRPGTPLLDDNQSGINLMASVPEGSNGIEQLYEEDSSGLSNSEILSDSEGSNENVPNLSELLSQYQNSSKATHVQERTDTPPVEAGHTTPTKSQPDEDTLNQPNEEHLHKQSIKSEDNTCSVIPVHKSTGQLGDLDSISKINVKEESTDVDKSFVPENYKSVGSPPSPSKHFKSLDHTYSEAGSHPSGTPLNINPSTPDKDRTFLTVIEHTSRNKGSDNGQRKVNPEVPLGEEIYQSIRKGCEEFLSAVNNPDHCSYRNAKRICLRNSMGFMQNTSPRRNLPTDVTLKLSDGTIEAQKMMLAYISPVFEKMFYENLKETNLKEVDLPNDSHKIMKLLLDIVFEESCEMESLDDIIPLMEVVERYQINKIPVQQMCDGAILTQMNAENYFILLPKFAHVMHEDDIQHAANQVMTFTDKKVITNYDHAKRIPEEVLLPLLQHKHFYLHDLEIFEFLIRWYKYQTECLGKSLHAADASTLCMCEVHSNCSSDFDVQDNQL